MKHFTKDELNSFETLLLELRQRLRGDVTSISNSVTEKNSQIESGSTSASPIHLAEAGTDTFEQEFAMSLLEAGSGHLKEIENALLRIKDGTYGTCENCGKQITKKRLEAIPYTNICIDCANARSKRRG